jgi:cobalt/nickel transport system permease protein
MVLAMADSFITAMAGLILGFILVILAGLKLNQILLRLVVVNSFIALLWLTLPLTYPGDPLYLGHVRLSRQGLELASLITIKSNAIILIFISLLATSNVSVLGHSMKQLYLPDKLCLLLIFSYRYIFVIYQEYQRLLRAAKLRNFRPATNLHTYRTYSHLFAMTFVKSWNRAERVQQAMALRGFQGTFYSLVPQKTNRKKDIILLAVLLVITVSLIVIELTVSVDIRVG